MSKTTKTINIGKGATRIDYAKVASRLAEFHKANKNNSIKTTYEFKEGFTVFKATVTPDVSKPEQSYDGTSFGKVTAIKAFEKLETIAVGRALAFAGYLSDGEIASDEEMVNYEEGAKKIDNTQAKEKLQTAKNPEALRLIWRGLTQAERDDTEVLALKNKIKEQYENSQSGTEKSRVASTPQG